MGMRRQPSRAPSSTLRRLHRRQQQLALAPASVRRTRPLLPPLGPPGTMQREQDYLVLLHHARKCPHDEHAAVPCPVYPEHCAATKRLWRHIAACTEYKSRDGCSHCLRARQILTHYRNCRDGRCPVCSPVRETVRLRRDALRRRREAEAGEEARSSAPPPLGNDTFSTEPSTAASDGTGTASRQDDDADTPVRRVPASHEGTIDEWVTRRRHALATIDCPAGRPWPSGSVSSLSHGCDGSSYLGSSARSVRSSVQGSAGGGSTGGGSRGSAGGEVYCEECRRLGIGRPGMPVPRRVCSGGIRCKSNMGIAHFCKVAPPRKRT